MLTALCSYACAIAAILAHVALASRGITLPIVDDRSNLPLHGRICAYGDINKDRYTDLVVQRGAKLIILLQSEGGNFRDSGRYAPILLEKSAIVSCTVGDFNGDASPDILVVTVRFLVFLLLCVYSYFCEFLEYRQQLQSGHLLSA